MGIGIVAISIAVAVAITVAVTITTLTRRRFVNDRAKNVDTRLTQHFHGLLGVGTSRLTRTNHKQNAINLARKKRCIRNRKRWRRIVENNVRQLLQSVDDLLHTVRAKQLSRVWRR